MVPLLLLLLGSFNSGLGADNTTEPPMVNYHNNFGSPDELFLTNLSEEDDNGGDSDDSTGHPIIIDLPTDDTDDEDEDMVAETFSLTEDEDPLHVGNNTIDVEPPFPDWDNVDEQGGQDRIINGFFARLGSLPIKARIFPTFSRTSNVCGATILTTRHLLTAAHCLFQGSDRLRRVGIRVGSISDRRGGQFVFASRAIVHGRYRNTNGVYAYDIAILRTATVMRFNSYVQPAALPVSNPRIGSFDFAAGWGITQNGRISEFLKYARVRVSQCRRFPPGTPSRSALVCTQNSRDRTCLGDSGGFLGAVRSRRWVVDGVVSFGPVRCPSSGTTGFTSVAFFGRWIISTVRNN